MYPTSVADSKQLLATRLLDQAKPTMLPGTERGADPFFSPDGLWVGFYASGLLKKISVQGGAPVTLAFRPAVGPPRDAGASWSQDRNIIVGSYFGPLLRIPAVGGPPQPLTKLGPGETNHCWPQVLPGNAVLFTASPSTTSVENANIEAISLKTGQVKTVQRGGYYGRYLPSGHLVYVRQGTLFGVRFDLAKLEVRGAPVPVLEDVAANSTDGGGQFDFSGTGTLVYAAGKPPALGSQMAWLERSGKMEPLLDTQGWHGQLHFSPDGKKLAFLGDSQDIYIHDLERGTTSRLTFTDHAGIFVWAPDGKHLVFRYMAQGSGFWWVRSDGSGEPQPLLESGRNIVPDSFAPDGRRLAYQEINPATGADIWTLPVDITEPDDPKPGAPEPFLRTPANEQTPRFSPDGRWIAYRSNESGNNEIYVRPFPTRGGGKWLISSGGGLYPFWSHNGRELFYETAEFRIMVVEYTVNGASFVAGKPRLWSDKQLVYPGTLNLDLAPDGKHFAVLTPPPMAAAEKGSVHVVFLQNFFDELKRRIP